MKDIEHWHNLKQYFKSINKIVEYSVLLYFDLFSVHSMLTKVY